MNYSQGSEWRKWDLHVHTPASLEHHYPGTETKAWDAFLNDLESLPSEFKVIGINDYLFLDGYKRVCGEKTKGRLANIDLILPVVELRLDKFVGHDSHFQRVNFHVIFDVIDPEVIETQFINLLSREFRLLPVNAALQGRWSAVPTRKSLADFGQMIINAAPAEKKVQYGAPLQEGFNNFNVTLDNVHKALDSSYFKGRYLTAVGKTEWDAIKWSDASIAEKRNVIHNADVVFISSETVTAFEKAREALVKANVNSKLLDCSDAHHLSNAEVKDRVGKCFTWIKADTTFAGLQHAINEYGKRVFVADEPEKLVKVRTNKTKHIRSVQIKKVVSSNLSEQWFDCSLPLNTDLVAIIGNKGSGKSALADTLGHLGDTKQNTHFSFLNDQKFCDPRDNKATHFEATLIWESGALTTKRLDADPVPDSVETVKYLPQNYIEKLCNEIVTGGDSEFDRELKQIIFSHVDMSDRLGRDTLDDVLSYLTSETRATIRVLSDRVHAVNQEIVQYEERDTDSHRTHLESRLRIKREELATHEQSKPSPVLEPTQSEELKKVAAKIREEIAKKKAGLGILDKEIIKLDKARSEYVRKIAVIDRATVRIDNFGLQFDEFKQMLSADLQELNSDPPIRFEDIAQVSIDSVKLARLRTQLVSELEGVDDKLDSSKDGSLVAKKQSLEDEIQKLQDSLDEPNKKFVAYQNALEAWNTKHAVIVGNADIPESIQWLELRIKGLASIPEKLGKLRAKRAETTREIYREIKKLSDSYCRLYHSVQEFIDKQRISDEAIPLSFQVAIVDDGFADNFLEKINRQVRGTFSGIEESNTLVRRRLQAVDLDKEDSVIEFIEEIYNSLHVDKRLGAPEGSQLRVRDQLRKGETVLSVYDYLFTIPFLTPRYMLRYSGHEIQQLAPGERGLLLLVFYLLIDKNEIPLVIDQPEENLDNQTIYEVLVKCLADAKRRRQVIVVTHNPNLAVVCDAEQVIYARGDKISNTITYESGAIENPIMNKHIIDVLEGTRPAFKNRDSKYFI